MKEVARNGGEEYGKILGGGKGNKESKRVL